MDPGKRRSLLLALLAGVLLLGAVVWRSLDRESAVVVAPDRAREVSASVIDPGNDEQRVTIRGLLVADPGASDSELDIVSMAPILFRDVQMYQWQEQCVANGCGQSKVWSAMRIDSSAFREQGGNTNPDGFPFANARFTAPSIRIGAFTIDPDLVAVLDSMPRPVTVDELPPNLAAIFREIDGSLYSGEDARNPAIGDLRVSYRVVPAAEVTLSGVQRGGHLVGVRATH